MINASRYGDLYWCAKVTKDLSSSGEIYVMGDEIKVENGALIFLRNKKEPVLSKEINLIIPAQKWTAVFAASVMDGHAVAVEHWPGEIYEPGDNDRVIQASNAALKKKTKCRAVTKTLRYRILNRDEFKCVSCGKGKDQNVILEVDHVVPNAMGGETSVENLQTLCRDCNRGKGAYSSDI